MNPPTSGQCIVRGDAEPALIKQLQLTSDTSLSRQVVKDMNHAHPIRPDGGYATGCMCSMNDTAGCLLLQTQSSIPLETTPCCSTIANL